MKTRLLILRLVLCLGLIPAGSSLTSLAQTAPAPPPVPQIRKDKEAEAAAAIQAPAPSPSALKPPPVPGMKASPSLPPPVPPTIPDVPRPNVAIPAPPADSSDSKMEALEAVTKKNEVTVAPRIPTRAEKLPVTTSTSSSGQFLVYGKELTTRSAMSSHLDKIAAEMRAVLNDSQPHGQSIVVQLNTGEDAAKQPPGTPPVSVVITEITSGGFHLQLTVTESADLKLSDLRRETVRILLAERIVRGRTKITKPEDRLMLPDWLFTGVIEAMDFRAAARPSTMFAAIFQSGKIYGIEEILEVSPAKMDSLSRAIYETSCAALVMALADQPSGGQALNQFLSSLAADPRPERELLEAAFPKFAANSSSLNKWWSLQMATLAKRGMAEPLGADESLRALEGAITIRYHAPVDEVPKDIKQRPFVIPAPLNVIPPPQPKSEPKTNPVALKDSGTKPVVASAGPPDSADQSNTTEDGTDESEEETQEEKANGGKRWLRFLTFGLAGRGDDPDAPPETQNDEAEAAEVALVAPDEEMPPKTVAEEQETSEAAPSLFSRLFSRDRLRAAEARQQAADEMARKAEEQAVDVKEVPEKAAAEVEKPKPTPTVKPEKDQKADEPTEEVEKESKRSMLNPLNWFRSRKKTDDTESPTDEEKGEKGAEPSADATSPGGQAKAEVTVLFDGAEDVSASALLRWYSPSLADTVQALSPPEPQYTFLDFLKRKKKEPEPEAVPAPAPEKEEEPKPKSTPPRSTNPNAKPAARPVQPTDGSRRTTNPAAKPVPVPKAPPPTPVAKDDDDWLGKPPEGMVEVRLPLEEYRHIMKSPDRKKILAYNEAALRALQLRSSVLFRPVVTGYLSVVLSLKDGETKDVDKTLELLREAALQALQNTKAVRDYLDWYEANETGRLSGKFDDFLNLPAIIQRELPPREDPISQYLDAVDRQFSK